jgi:uncharacterized protein (TIGR02145 family)/uncharacterized repeat protein (TIGR02543 family)
MTDSRIIRRYVSGLFFLATMVFCACTQVPEYCGDGGPFDFTNYYCKDGRAYPKTPLAVTYTVTWNVDGGSPVPTQTSVGQGGQITAPAAMTKTGYTFGGWYTNSGLTAAAAFPITNVTENKTFYAKWTVVSSGGGSNDSSVVIGGKTWMKKNLNVETADSWCYENSTANCTKYGRFYTWAAAKTACQSVGWRLPDTADWRRLVDAAGGYSTAGSKLKSQSDWTSYSGISSTDEFGFSALPGGYRNSDGYFLIAGDVGNWWTATENSSGGAYYRYMDYDYDYVNEDYYDESYGFSVRCVKDN